MNIDSIKSKLQLKSIYHSKANILDKPSIIGYEKKFKWKWMATQLNTFIIVSDFDNDTINNTLIENHLKESFNYAQNNYNGLPRGFLSGLGVISILISSEITEESKEYCRKLESEKKWAGFAIPVVIDSKTKTIYYFEKNPIWGRIYYPYFKEIINSLLI
ncbi:MAG: hypothetical protein ACOYOT_05720 [Bacteroidales bacterium]